jgi:hypothetical protein
MPRAVRAPIHIFTPNQEDGLKERVAPDRKPERRVASERAEERALREAQNVLSSYSHATDFMAEALQNAADAIDERRAKEQRATARIQIVFDTRDRQLSVADTGVGMSYDDVRVVLTPNVTTKTGRYAPGRRSRGEKGVGLSFLALASNYLHIRTCDGRERQDVTVKGARDWVRSGATMRPPTGAHESNDPDEYLGSSRYTIVTIGDIDPLDFDGDLFGYSVEELVWKLRTLTAVGNTRYLFESPFDPSLHAREIEVKLRHVSAAGVTDWEVPYAYATPEELAPGRRVVAFEEVADLPPAEQVRRLRGAAVRYVAQFRTPSNRIVGMYAFITNGDDMRALLKERQAEWGWAPSSWQGFYIATRGMPTGVTLGESVITTRAYERRVFALLSEDELMLDVGRKTLHGQTRNMLASIAKLAWNEELARVTPRVGAAAVSAPDLGALDVAMAQARRLENLNWTIPYLKTPASRAGVIAVFHELVAQGRLLPRLRTLRTGTFIDDDALIFKGEPDGLRPLHVLFGKDAHEVIRVMEAQEGLATTADLAVVWDLSERRLQQLGVEVSPAEAGDDGATHTLLLNGVAGRDQLRAIALSALGERATQQAGEGVGGQAGASRGRRPPAQ